jgi:hypothetical protein
VNSKKVKELKSLCYIGLCNNTAPTLYDQPIVLSEDSRSSVIAGEYFLEMKSTIIIRETERPGAPGTYENAYRLSFSTSQTPYVKGIPPTKILQDVEVVQGTYDHTYESSFTLNVEITHNPLWVLERETRVIQLSDAGAVFVLLMISVYSALVIATKAEKKVVTWITRRANKRSDEYHLLDTNKISVA